MQALEGFASGLLSGLTINPVVKYGFIFLLVGFPLAKFYKWWITFKNKV
ncbi:hypothetical protein [Bacillus sp. B1-b2]|nr:hypothetical protein [Bacillus sp. B1-b2]